MRAGKTFVKNFLSNNRAVEFFRGGGLCALAATGIVALALLACEQPFRAGLGVSVDIEEPVVRIVTPIDGGFISEQVRIDGNAWDDRRVDGVRFRIVEHPGFARDFYPTAEEEEDILGWRHAELGSVARVGNRVTLDWRFEYLDTAVFRDGELRVRLEVTDGIVRDDCEWTWAGRDWLFEVRNSPPTVTMRPPAIGAFDPADCDCAVDLAPGQICLDCGFGLLGGRRLNRGFAESGVPITILQGERDVDGTAGMIVGMIRDPRGVNVSARPPVFRLWEIRTPPPPGESWLPLPSYIQTFDPGVIPDESVVPWREFGVGQPLGGYGAGIMVGSTFAQFFYRFDHAAQGRYFAFQVEASNEPEDGGYVFTTRFPRDMWSAAQWNALPPEERDENSFIAFFVTEPQEPPNVDLLELQNIFGEAWVADAVMEFPNIPNLTDDMPHPFLTSRTFNAKSDRFTLRVRASHSRGIEQAMAIWEGGGRRGRFIWDPADTPVPNPTWWDPANNVPDSQPFTSWGRGSSPRKENVRHFVFTFTGDEYIHNQPGRRRVQVFNGTDAEWNVLYGNIGTAGGWDNLRDSPLWGNDDWDGREGVFTVRVYARTTPGGISHMPLVTSLTLDNVRPVVEFTRIDGDAGETRVVDAIAGETRNAYVVNSVIRTRFFATDARPIDSNLRESAGYFARPGGGVADEVMFALVSDADRPAMNAFMASEAASLGRDFWPLPSPAPAGAVPVFGAGVTIHRHGPVLDGEAHVKTSCIDCSDPNASCNRVHELPPLADGLYWMYVFARDRAFNVGRGAFPLYVVAESDRPTFDFGIGLVTTYVTNPNREAEDPSHAEYGSGFNYGGAVRNRLFGNTNIRFRVRDFDSLDLTRMRIFFEGSFVDAAYRVRPLSERNPGYRLELNVADVFQPRTGASPLREREGTVLQYALLGLLRGSALYRDLHGPELDDLNSLPDGLYFMYVEVWDDPAFKLPVPAPGQADARTAVRASVGFWLAVDSVPPTVDLEGLYPPNESYRPRDEWFYIGTQRVGGEYLGTVFDDNGPISVAGFTVTVTDFEFAPGYSVPTLPVNVLSRPLSQLSGSGQDEWVTLNRFHENKDTWEYRVSAAVRLETLFPGIEAGVFDFTLTLRDRFGNPTVINRRHRMDQIPPTVFMRPLEPPPFSRPSAAATHNISPVNASRLVNDVVSFTAHATDNFTVSGIHWWLLPAGRGASTGAIPGAQGSLDATGDVQGFDSFPARNPAALATPIGRAFPITEGGAVVGAFGRIDGGTGGTAYIDTRAMGLPEGEYHLHVIARDAWGNHSLIDHRPQQRFFLLQYEDKPYFHGVSPDSPPGRDEVRNEHNLLITGAIMDDDGFGRGANPEPGSVYMWISTAPPPEGVDWLNTAWLEASAGWRGGEVPNRFLIPSGRDVILNIDLVELHQYSSGLFPDVLALRQGAVHYVIRARDAWQSKLAYPDRTLGEADRLSRYRHFRFVLDAEPPVMILTEPSPDAPAQERIFGVGFDLRGHATDVSLARMAVSPGVYRPFVSWTRSGAIWDGFNSGVFVFDDEPEPFADGLERAFLDAPIHGFFGVADFDDVPEGSHTLEMMVVDMIGNASAVTLGFTVDRTAPRISANFPGGEADPRDDFDVDWWLNAPAPGPAWTAWNDDRRDWAAERDLPVIVHDGGGAAPRLAGRIVDEFSDVDISDIRFRFNDGPWFFLPESAWEGMGRTRMWSAPLTANGLQGGATLGDGLHALTIENARDGTGNEAPRAAFVFRMDSATPTLALDAQPEASRVLGNPDWFDGPTALTVSGNAAGANLRGVRIRFLRDGQPMVFSTDPSDGSQRDYAIVDEGTWTWLPNNSTLAWSFELGVDCFGSYFAAEGDYEVEVVALGWRAGGGSEPAFWTFARDTSPPVVAFASGFNHSSDYGLGPAQLRPDHPAINLFVGDSLTIHGSVVDAFSDVRRVERLIERWVDGAWATERDWSEMTNLAGSPRDRVWRTEDLGGTTGGLSDGLYRLRVRAMDSSRFDVSAPGYFGDGLTGNPAISEWMYFFFDRAAPTLGFVGSPPQFVSPRLGGAPGFPGFLGFHVEAADSIGLRYVRAEIEGQAAANVALPVFDLWDRDPPAGETANYRLISAANGDPLGWWAGRNEFVLFVPAAGISEGRHVAVVTAEGLSGRAPGLSGALRRSVDVDLTSPSGNFATPEIGVAGPAEDGFPLEYGAPHLGSAPAEISGEADDAGHVNSGVARVDFRFGLMPANPDGSGGLVMPTPERLAARYTQGSAASDTRHNDHLFDAAPTWFLLGRFVDGVPGLSPAGPMPAGFSRGRDNLFSWQIMAAEGALLELALREGMSRTFDGLLEMPMWLRVVDGAGNAGYFHRVIRINPEADRPVNVIRSPASDTDGTSPRGGSIFLDGLAQIGNTDVSVNSVLYRVWVTVPGVGPGTGRRLLTTADMPTAIAASSDDMVAIGRYAALGTGQLAGGNWFAASVDPGFMAEWNFGLNAGNEITALIPANYDTMPVEVEVVALNDLGGVNRQVSVGGGSPDNPEPSRRSFHLTSSAPSVTNVRVDSGSAAPSFPSTPVLTPVLNNPHRGPFVVSALLDPGSADQSISQVRIIRRHETGAATDVTVWGGTDGAQPGFIPWAGVEITENPDGTLGFVYRLDSGLNAAPSAGAAADWVMGGAWRYGGGEYLVEIRVYDGSEPPAIATASLSIYVDNFAPVADPALHANPLQAGRGVFQGRVLDGVYGAGSGRGAEIDRVYAWFERGGYVPDFAAGAGAIGSAVDVSVLRGRTADFAGADRSNVTIAAPGALETLTVPARAMRISGATAGLAVGRENGHIWENSPDNRVVQWQFSAETSRLGDGPIALWYVVVDTAGNASVFSQRIVVRNNSPRISRVVLHTSATGAPPTITAGAVDPATSALLDIGRSAGNAGFIEIDDFAARNRWLGFTVDTVSVGAAGNPPLHYRAQHVSRESIPLTPANVREMARNRMNPPANAVGYVANVYTIHQVTGTVAPADWNVLGVIGTPDPGAHFVFMPGCVTEIWPSANPNDADNDAGLAPLPATVWRYTVLREAIAESPTASGVVSMLPANGLRFESAAFAPVADPYNDGYIRQGRNYFLVRVWDSVIQDPGAAGGVGHQNRPLNVNDQMHDALVVAVDARLVDTERPVALLHDLNPGFLTGVTGGNLTVASRDTTARNALYPPANPTELNNNANRGGLFNVGSLREPARSGHIEPRSASAAHVVVDNVSTAVAGNALFDGTTIERDLVSGRIILRGRVTDNERVERVQLRIGEGVAGQDTDWFTVLEWNPAALSAPFMRVPTGAAISAAPAVQALVNENAVRFRETLSWQDGHEVEWAFLWDTETFNGGAPVSDVRVNVRARDGSGQAATQYSDAAAGGANNRVDIVPYVTGFRRHGPTVTPPAAMRSYATIRSMQGWYSFYQGETRIVALGFNLNGVPSVAGANSVGGAGMALDAPTNEPAGGGANRLNPTGGYHLGGARMIRFNVPAGAQSGRINLLIGVVPIHNHRSHPDRAWNSENLPAGDVTSALWLNRPYAHVWRTAHHDAAGATGDHIPRTIMGPMANSVGADHPGMTLEYSGAGASLGRLHGTWGVFGTAMIHYGTNERGSVTGGTALANTRLSTGIPGDPFITPDISTFNGSNMPVIALVHMQDGQPSLRFRAPVRTQVGGVGDTDFPSLTGNPTGNPTQRWRNIRTSAAAANANTAANPGRLFTTAYDAFNRSLVFIAREGTVNAAALIDGGGAGATVGGFAHITAGAGSAARSASAGLFSAVGHDAHGVIIAYYDATNDTIRVALSNSLTPAEGAAGGWTRHEILAGSALHGGSGRHVSMAVDGAGGIHLAFFNSRLGALVYAYAPPRAAAAAAPVFTAMVVDGMEGVGTWTDISVDHWGNPWIVYGYQGRQGNFDGVRVAYRSRNPNPHRGIAANAAQDGSARFTRVNSCRVTGNDITGWEAAQMAAPFRVANDRLNIEAWPPCNRAVDAAAPGAPLSMAAAHRVGGAADGRAWSAAIGYASGAGDNRFRVGYFFWPDLGAAATNWPPAPPSSAP